MTPAFSARHLVRARGPLTLFALLALLVLLPAGIVVWFMNEAIVTQSAVARRTVLEAHRGQLRLVRSRVEAHWHEHAESLSWTGTAATTFERLVREQAADGLVLLNADGSVAFPDDDPGSGDSAQAVRIRRDIDRLPALAAASRAEALQDISGTLNDYTVPLSGAARLALMERLRTHDRNVMLPTEAALRLSLAAARLRPIAEPAHFLQTSIRRVWTFASADRRTIALYWTERIEAMMHDLLHQVAPAGVRFITYPPDTNADPEAIAAGAALPGWQLTFQPLDRTIFEDAGRQRALVYIAVGASGLAAIGLVGLAAAGAFRRHLRVARLKTDLVAAVSHELRTPLASMRILVDGLLEDDELDERKTREYLRLLAGESARLSRVVEDFLTFSRLERGRQQFTFAPTRAAAVVEAAVEAVRDRLPPGCDLKVDIASDVPPVVADRDALATGLVNLLDNAIKYTPAEKHIHIRVDRADRAVQFAVADNGIGIAARERRRIFRRFYRVDQRLARETGGVGLGLSIVEMIAQAHGGSVTVASEPGRGSTFTLCVPAAHAAEPVEAMA